MSELWPTTRASAPRVPTAASQSAARWALPLGLLACTLASAGCSTYPDRIREVRGQFYVDNLVGARATLEKARKHHGKEADCLALEQAMIELADGQPKQAEQLLRKVRDHFDELDGKNLGEETLAMITDDNRRAYAGEDYEKVLVRAMLAISNLMGDGGDAGAYALQVGDKQQQIIQAGVDKHGDNPKLSYQRVAVGPYLHGLLREQTHSNYDDAARASAMVCSWQPDFPYARQDLERAQHGRHSAPGNGVLYVFTLVGYGPYKEEAAEIPSTAALLVADRILSATGKYTLPPTIAPVKVPKVVVPPSPVRDVRVTVDQQAAGSTATITDISQMALQQCEAVYPRVLARAVVRRVVKKGIIYGAKELIHDNQKYSPTNLALDVAGVAWEASEAADTRCWGLLPGRIQVLRVELPAGQHQVMLQPTTYYGSLGDSDQQLVPIANGRNTYLLAMYPDVRRVGKMLVNQP